MKKINTYRYINRERSWLAFNARVLQEANDSTVPLLDRLRFVGIFSNNLDEFFSVRYALMRRLNMVLNQEHTIDGLELKKLLTEITETVIVHQAQSLKILKTIKYELEAENIFVVNENELNKQHQTFVKNFFTEKVSPELVTIVFNDFTDFPILKDNSGYLAIKMVIKETHEIKYAIIEIPNSINRFVELPTISDKQYLIMLDDLIRFNLNRIFNIFDYESISSYMIKFSRDAQLDFDTDLHKSFLDQVSLSVKDRRIGEVVRFVYDKKMDKDMLQFFMTKMEIDSTDSIIPGGRYHKRRDYMNFPDLGRKDLMYASKPPLPINGLSLDDNILDKISKRDYLLNTPYQTFSYVIKFLREAAIDPNVTSIKITLYRLARQSQIVSSLINAAKNGKKVTVQIELQARFDEANNIKHAELMQLEGIKLIFGVKGLKVHSKICLIERNEGKSNRKYGFISSGNFNESTSRVYTDVTLFTSNQKILKDVEKVFEFLDVNYKVSKYKHIIVSPHNTRTQFCKLIDREIKNAHAGLPAYLKLKMNSLTDLTMVDKLYEANNAGVNIKLLIRGICCLIPGVKGMSERIEAISIIDNFLEHSRIYIFSNNNNPEVYISSADFMNRNLSSRVEVSCPIYDDQVKQELIDSFDIAWKGNVKARIHSEKLTNEYRVRGDEPVFRAQQELYNFYKNKLEN